MLKRPGGGFPPVSWPLGEETGLGGRIASRLRAPPRRRSSRTVPTTRRWSAGGSSAPARTDRTALQRCGPVIGVVDVGHFGGVEVAVARMAEVPDLLHGLRSRRRRRRGGHVLRGGRGVRLARRYAHRLRCHRHLALHRRAQRLRVPARVPRHPAAERGAWPSPDAGQDRALPPDTQALARATAGSLDPRRAAGLGSMPSATPTTKSDHGPSAGGPPPRPTGRRRWPCPPVLAPRVISACATTWPTRRVPSACAGPAACTTARSALPMPVDGSWLSSTSVRSPSSTSAPVRSSRAT